MIYQGGDNEDKYVGEISRILRIQLSRRNVFKPNSNHGSCFLIEDKCLSQIEDAVLIPKINEKD